jgi:hypothetical protein
MPTGPPLPERRMLQPSSPYGIGIGRPQTRRQTETGVNHNQTDPLCNQAAAVSSGPTERPEAAAALARREDGTWLLDGMVSLDEVKQILGVSALPGEDPELHTLGGYMMARLHRAPMVADRVTAGDFLFEIVDMGSRRVDRVLIMPATAQAKRG